MLSCSTVYFLLLAEEIFQTYLKGWGFAEEHNWLTSRHKLLLNRRQRDVSTQEGNARSAWLVAIAFPWKAWSDVSRGRDNRIVSQQYHNQRRNEVRKGTQFPGRPFTAGELKSSRIVTSTFVYTVNLLPQDLGFEHESAKLVSCSERHLTSLRTWQNLPLHQWLQTRGRAFFAACGVFLELSNKERVSFLVYSLLFKSTWTGRNVFPSKPEVHNLQPNGYADVHMQIKV